VVYCGHYTTTACTNTNGHSTTTAYGHVRTTRMDDDAMHACMPVQQAS